jgi:hypothetical protein
VRRQGVPVDTGAAGRRPTPFPDPWSFDVELLARLLHPGAGLDRSPADEVLEVPLRVWRDVAGDVTVEG